MDDHISFWIFTLAVPLVVVMCNALVRALVDLPQSASADIALALIIFDAAVVINSNEFENKILMAPVRPSIIAVYTLMIIFGMLLWALAVFVAEKQIAEYYDKKHNAFCDVDGCQFSAIIQQPKFPIFGYFLSLFIPVVQIVGSIGPFAIRWP